MDDARRDRLTRVAVLVLGVYQLGIALYGALAPRSFFENIGPYGVFNRHYIQDLSAFEAALGAGALFAAARPGWRAPVLVVAAFHFGFHTISHLVDMGESDPGWKGPAAFVSLLAVTALLAWLASVAARARNGASGGVGGTGRNST